MLPHLYQQMHSRKLQGNLKQPTLWPAGAVMCVRASEVSNDSESKFGSTKPGFANKPISARTEEAGRTV